MQKPVVHPEGPRIPGAVPLPAGPRPAWVWTRRLLIAALLAVSLAYLPYRVYLRSGVAHLIGLQAELDQVRADNGKLRQDNRRLHRELDRLKDDELAIERVAREELGLVRPGEIVFKVVEPPAP